MPPSKRGKIVIYGYAMLFLGEFYVCVISLFTFKDLDTGNWQALTIWSTVPALFALFISIPYLDESVRFLLSSKRYDEAVEVLEKSIKATKNTQITQITPEIKKDLINWVEYQDRAAIRAKQSEPGLRALFQKRYYKTTLILWMSWFAISYTYYGVTLFFPYILNQISDDQTAKKGSVVSGIEAVASDNLVSYTVSIAFESFSIVIAYFVIDSKRLGRKGGMVLFFGASSIFCFLAFVSQSKILFILWTTIIKIFIDVVTFYCYLLTLEAYPTKFRATGIGAAVAVGKAGTVIMPWISAFLIEWTIFGPYMGFFTVNVLAFISCILLPVRATADMK